jgi:hypothetical protein
MFDEETRRIGVVLQKPFDLISCEVSNDYGGSIEHLWIDFELIRHWTKRRPPFAFRYQKRVSGDDKLTGIRHPDQHNVGHYSVRPDFDVLLGLPTKNVPLMHCS